MCIRHGRLFCSECNNERKEEMNLLKLQHEVWKIAEEKGWHENQNDVSFGDFISNCHAELSEAFEIYRVEGEKGIPIVKAGNTLKPEGITVELADVVMRILDFCETHGIPLYRAIEMKMNFNKTREHRHGGKIV
jgi:NTP pyrophosphatase (non-canonical NTP hydrolase)